MEWVFILGLDLGTFKQQKLYGFFSLLDFYVEPVFVLLMLDTLRSDKCAQILPVLIIAIETTSIIAEDSSHGHGRSTCHPLLSLKGETKKEDKRKRKLQVMEDEVASFAERETGKLNK